MKQSLLLILVALAAGCDQGNTQAARYSTSAQDGAPVDPSPVTRKLEEDAIRRTAILTVNEAVKGFRVIEKRYPSSLDEVVHKGFLRSLPVLPEGNSYQYDAETGQVTCL